MDRQLKRFEQVARRAHLFNDKEVSVAPTLHPFDERNIYPRFPAKVRRLFDDGYYEDATFTAFKFVDKTVQELAGMKESGYKLMMSAFDTNRAKVQLNGLTTVSEIDEQEGFRMLFAGGIRAIRNPRGHEFEVRDDPDVCLDHLSFASLLLRRLEQAKLI